MKALKERSGPLGQQRRRQVMSFERGPYRGGRDRGRQGGKKPAAGRAGAHMFHRAQGSVLRGLVAWKPTSESAYQGKQL